MAGHFSRTLADKLNANYIANEYYSSGSPDKRKQINFALNDGYLSRQSDMDSDVLREFISDIADTIKPGSKVIYIGTAGGFRENDIHFLIGGAKGSHFDVEESTCRDIEDAERMYSALHNEMAEIGLKCATHEEYGSTNKKHLCWAIHRICNASVVRLQIGTVILWDQDDDKYFRAINGVYKSVIG